MTAISAWQAVAWAMLGVAGVELLQCAVAVLRSKRWPWGRQGEPSTLAFLASVPIRLLASAGLAWAAAAGGHITTAVGALAVGACAPLLLEQVVRLFPPSPRGSGDGS